MSRFPAIKRQLLIIDYINGIYRSKDQIIEYLEEKDIQIDKRTLTRDFNDLRDYLECDIDYIKGKGHILNHSRVFKLDLLNRFNTITKLNKVMGEETKLSEFVLDNSIKKEWTDLIPEILKGLEEKRYIEFDYRKYTESQSSQRRVIPLWLKEDKELWYLIALPVGSDELRTFGLDRIKNLTLNEKYDDTHITPTIIDQVDDFKYRLGISYPTFEPVQREIIELAVSDFLLPYWNSNPIHPTQRITNEKVDGHSIVTFLLIPNIDLIKLIVSGLGDIKLLKPIALKKHIHKEFKSLMGSIF